MAASTGLEPAIFSVTDWRGLQLPYEAIYKNIKGQAEYIFQYHFKSVGTSNLTYLTYLTERLDLTRFNVFNK